jgi:hypothetical protein
MLQQCDNIDRLTLTDKLQKTKLFSAIIEYGVILYIRDIYAWHGRT